MLTWLTPMTRDEDIDIELGFALAQIILLLTNSVFYLTLPANYTSYLFC